MKLPLKSGILLKLTLVLGVLVSIVSTIGTEGQSVDVESASQTPYVRGRDNSALLVDGRVIRPFGIEVGVCAFPLAQALSPDGRVLIISCSAPYGRRVLQVLNIESKQIVNEFELGGSVLSWSSHPRDDALTTGLAFSQGGDLLAAGGPVIHVFRLTNQGTLSYRADIDPAGKYVMGLDARSDGLVAVDLGGQDITFRNRSIPLDGDPYAACSLRDGDEAVTRIFANRVEILDLDRGVSRASVEVDGGPAAITCDNDNDRIYVASSRASAMAVIDQRTLRVISTVSFSNAQAAAYEVAVPTSIAISHKRNRLFVTLAQKNEVAIVDIARTQPQLIGFVPTFWYPASVLVDDERNELYVLNTKGRGAGANGQGGPNPETIGGPNYDGYYNVDPDKNVLSMLRGNLQIISTDSSIVGLAGQEGFSERQASPDSPPAWEHARRTIQHVIYIIRENRSYDQILGDIGLGRSDPALALFGEKVTPNAHMLARRYGIFDNFYTSSEGSADGHEWSLGADSADLMQKLASQLTYLLGIIHMLPDSAAENPHGYLWDAAKVTGISYRVYGEGTQPTSGNFRLQPTREPCDGPAAMDYASQGWFGEDLPIPNIALGSVICLAPEVPTKWHAALIDHVDPRYRGWDSRYSDLERYSEWAREFSAFERDGSLPQLEVVYLPNDHTVGTLTGAHTPKAMVAENDLALGKLVERVSHSVYWKNTLIVVLEDDASNGGDHVDAHRSPVLLISPWTAHSSPSVNPNRYDTVAAVKTIEEILGLKPFTQFDHDAAPMTTAFTGSPDYSPYSAIRPNVDMRALNGPHAPFAKAVEHWDFSRPDAVNPARMNKVLSEDARSAQKP